MSMHILAVWWAPLPFAVCIVFRKFKFQDGSSSLWLSRPVWDLPGRNIPKTGFLVPRLYCHVMLNSISCYVFSVSFFYCKCSSGAFWISNKLLKPLLLNIWDLSSVELITKFDKRLLAWVKRKLKLTCRITVIKSLALSKFTHLFLFHYLTHRKH